MRRSALTAMIVLAAAGCGRTGPAERSGARTFLMALPPAGAGEVEISIGDSLAITCPLGCGPFTFQPGTPIRLEATGDDGVFSEWLGDAADCGSANPCEYVATSDQMVSSEWLAHVVVIASGAGLVTSNPPGIDCPGPACESDFVFGSTIELTGAGTGAVLEAWGGDCADDLDSRCQLAVDGEQSVVAWFGGMRADLFGTIADEFAEAIAADPLVPGGYVIAGSHYGPMQLGTASLPWSTGQDAFVARFDETGTATWSGTVGGAGNIRPHTLDLGVDDGVLACYVGGSFTGFAAYDARAAAIDPQGALNGFLGKYRVDATDPVWWHPLSGSAADNNSLVAAIDVDGNRLAIAGTQSGVVTFPPALAVGGGSQGNRKHGFTALLDSAGNILHAVHHGKNGGAHAEADAVLLGSNGTIVAGGRQDVVNDTAGLGGPCQSTTNASDIDGWLFSLAPDFGACGINQTRKLRATGKNHDSALAAGPGGTFLAAGYTRTTTDLGPTVSQHDASGVAMWTVDGTGPTRSGAVAAAWDATHGEWVIAGSFDGTITIGANSYTTAGGFDIFVAWLSPIDGSPSAVKIIGGAGDDVVGGPDLPESDLGEQHGHAATALAVLPGGTAVLAGYTRSPALLRRTNAATSGTADAVVLHVVRGP